jgi:hypothetical protein
MRPKIVRLRIETVNAGFSPSQTICNISNNLIN